MVRSAPQKKAEYINSLYEVLIIVLEFNYNSFGGLLSALLGENGFYDFKPFTFHTVV